MNFICIDTSKKYFAIALKTTLSKYFFSDNAPSHTCLKHLDNMLDLSEESLDNIDCISVVLGPGSFTGVRVGLGYAKGLVFGNRKHMVGLNSFEIAGLASKRAHATVVILSNLDNIYVANFKDGRATDFAAMKMSDFGQYSHIYTSDTIVALDQSLSDFAFSYGKQFAFVWDLREAYFLASEQAIERKDFVDINTVDCIYLKKPQAEEK